MPLYEYQCQQCGRRTEKIQKFSDPELIVCPHCGGVLERTVTAPAVQFKGSGWYKDLYSSAKPAEGVKSSSAEAGSSSSESKGESKSESTSASKNDSKGGSKPDAAASTASSSGASGSGSGGSGSAPAASAVKS